jgi:putative hydrolase of the HAD superfamily
MVDIEKQTDYNSLVSRYCRRLKPIATGSKAMLSRIERIRAVIFDIYGTLFISASGDIGRTDLERSVPLLADVLKAAGISVGTGLGNVAIADLLRVEIHAEHERQKLRGTDYPEVDIVAVWKSVLCGLRFPGWTDVCNDDELVKKIVLIYELWVNPVWPMPGVTQTLAALREKRILMGVISNAQFYTPIVIRGLLGKSLPELGFDPELTLFSYTVSRAKPSSMLFALLAARLKQHHSLEPGEVLYVGNDMLNDILPAARCGFKTVLFAGDARSLRLRPQNPECKTLKPDAVITDLQQVAKVLTPGE